MKLIDILEDQNSSEETQLRMLKQDLRYIGGFPDPTIRVQQKALHLACIVDGGNVPVVKIMDKKGYCTEENQLAVVKQDWPAIEVLLRAGVTVPESVMLAAVSKNGAALHIIYIVIKDLPKAVVTTALTEPNFIHMGTDFYGQFVKDYFKDNTVLMNKWLRYRDNMRDIK
jgi:hypothetical protein